jgi:hypothetical protein
MSTAIPFKEIGICVKLMVSFYGIEDWISQLNNKKSTEISRLIDLTRKPQDMVGCSFDTIPGLADEQGSIVDISSQVLQEADKIKADLQIIQDQNSSYVIKLVEEISGFLDGIVASEDLFAENEARIRELVAMSNFMMEELLKMNTSNDDKQDGEPVVPSKCEELNDYIYKKYVKIILASSSKSAIYSKNRCEERKMSCRLKCLVVSFLPMFFYIMQWLFLLCNDLFFLLYYDLFFYYVMTHFFYYVMTYFFIML